MIGLNTLLTQKPNLKQLDPFFVVNRLDLFAILPPTENNL